MKTPSVIEVCPRCHRPWREHGDVILKCPANA